MKKMGNLYIFTGASGTGKTTVLNNMESMKKLSKGKKYSTRAYRGKGDDIVHVDRIEDAPDGIEYNVKGHSYRIDIMDIISRLENGEDVGMALSNIDVIKQIKEILEDRVKVYCISSPIDEKRLELITYKRALDRLNPDEKANLLENVKSIPKTKDEEMKMFELLLEQAIPGTELELANNISKVHTDYINNISLFDGVLLNYGTIEELIEQACNLVDNSKDEKSVVFMIITDSKSSSKELLKTVYEMKLPYLETMVKLAKREKSEKDTLGSVEPIGKDGVFPENFDIRYTFHKDEKFSGIEYAISTEDTRKKLSNGISLAVVSNFEQVPVFEEKFGDEHVVKIYIHKVCTKDEREKELKEIYESRTDITDDELKARIGDKDRVFKDYIKNMKNIDNVILNTTNTEELFLQFFKVLDSYLGKQIMIDGELVSIEELYEQGKNKGDKTDIKFENILN